MSSRARHPRAASLPCRCGVERRVRPTPSHGRRPVDRARDAGPGERRRRSAGDGSASLPAEHRGHGAHVVRREPGVRWIGATPGRRHPAHGDDGPGRYLPRAAVDRSARLPAGVRGVGERADRRRAHPSRHAARAVAPDLADGGRHHPAAHPRGLHRSRPVRVPRSRVLRAGPAARQRHRHRRPLRRPEQRARQRASSLQRQRGHARVRRHLGRGRSAPRPGAERDRAELR